MSNPAIDTAKEKRAAPNPGDVITLDNGVRVKVHAVPAALIDDVTRNIPTPQVPMWHNAEMERDEPNPNDPAYLQALQDADRERATAMIDACVIFGIELLDGVPEGDEWMKNLRFLEKRGQINLKGYDLKDPLEREFVYKRFVVAPIWLIMKVQELSSITPQEIDAQKAIFRSDEEG